jgi:hypothetical protein
MKILLRLTRFQHMTIRNRFVKPSVAVPPRQTVVESSPPEAAQVTMHTCYLSEDDSNSNIRCAATCGLSQLLRAEQYLMVHIYCCQTACNSSWLSHATKTEMKKCLQTKYTQWIWLNARSLVSTKVKRCNRFMNCILRQTCVTGWQHQPRNQKFIEKRKVKPNKQHWVTND